MSIASSIDGEKTGINLSVTYRVIFVTTVSIPRLTSCGDYGPIISSNLPRSAWIESRKGVWESIGAVIQACAGIHEHININNPTSEGIGFCWHQAAQSASKLLEFRKLT
jgi:hypothetical protein